YTFLLEEWVEMMKMLPSLQHLDLEITNVLPSPPSSSLGSVSVNNSGPRSSSSLLLSQSLWNVHPSCPSPPSSSSASSPTLVTRRIAAYRQSFSSSTSGSIGYEDRTNFSSTSSSRSSDNEEDLYLGGLDIEDERSGPIDDARSPSLPLLSSLSLSTPRLAPGETYRAATAGFSTGESDDDDLSLRPYRSKTQFHKSSHNESASTRRQTKQHRFDPRSSTRLPRQHQHPRKQYQDETSNARPSVHCNGGYDGRQQQQEEEAMMTPLVLSLVFQFPSVRSLIFRGPYIVPELLEFLPNLDSLALQPSPTPSNYSPEHVKSCTSSARRSFQSSLELDMSSSLFLDISRILQDKYPNITRLTLTEPSIMSDPSILGHLPVLFQTMPTGLVHVELSLSSSPTSSFPSPWSAGVKELEREVIDALIRHHGEHLQVFVVVAHPPSSLAKEVVDDPVLPRAEPYFAQMQQAHTPLDNVYFGFGGHQHLPTSQQQHQQLQRGDQGAAGQGAFAPTPSSTRTPAPTAHRTKSTNTPPTRPLLQVLESCPSLRIADCRLPIPLQEVIASFPNWVCHSRLQVLHLELKELSSTSGRAMDEDEEAVMEMFVKSLFIGSSSARVPLGEGEVDVKFEEKEEEMGSWRSTSEVGESSSWSSASAGGLGSGQGAGQVSPMSSFPPSPALSGSTTTATSGSSDGSMTATLPVHHTARGPAHLDETGLASRSQSSSSSLSSWTTSSSASQAPSTSTTTSSFSSSSSGASGASVSDAGQRRHDQQQRILGQSFATESPMSMSSASSALTGSSSVASSSSKAVEPTRGSYFPPLAFTPTSSPSSLSSTSTPSLLKSNSRPGTPSTSSSASSSSSTSSNPGDKRSRQAVSAFLSSCSNYQVDAVGRLMALQFLVEHQLAIMPRLECFYLGEKMFRIPSRGRV
ncbi:hypothetical protein BGW39_001634, partial [Mortierella sp. 14UC]